jgi:hypothetical protein
MADPVQLVKVVSIRRAQLVVIEVHASEDTTAHCMVSDCNWERRYGAYRGDAIAQAKTGSRAHLRMKHGIRE